MKILNVTKLHLSLFLKRRWLVVFTLILPVLLFVFFSVVFTNYEDIDRIPIGLIDLDQTELSNQVFVDLSSNPGIRIMSSEYEESFKLLKSNRIEAIFTLKQGFEEGIKTSDYKEIVKVEYLDKSSIGPALGDIIASDVMIPLAIYKAGNTSELYTNRYELENVKEKTITLGQRFVSESEFNMDVHTRVLTPSSYQEKSLDISKLLRTQMTFGYLVLSITLILSFSQMYQLSSDFSEGKNRLRIAGYKEHHLYYGQILSLLIMGTTIVIIESMMISFTLSLSMKDVFTILMNLLNHVFMVSILITVLQALGKTKVRYQNFILPLIFAMGLLGGAFWDLSFIAQELRWITYISPVHWTLSGIQSTILGTSQSLSILVYASLCLLFLLLGQLIYLRSKNEKI